MIFSLYIVNEMPTVPSQLNPVKFQKYIFRLPLFTRIILLLLVAFWILELQSAWDVPAWGALVPQKVNLGTSKLFSKMIDSGLELY